MAVACLSEPSNQMGLYLLLPTLTRSHPFLVLELESQHAEVKHEAIKSSGTDCHV